MRQITVTESLFVAASPERVWDLTQDYRRRSQWDANVLSAEVLPGAGPPRVRLRLRGGVACVFQYKVFERPLRTSLAMTDVVSPVLAGGGGAWTYAAQDGGTLWTQTNTLVFKNALLGLCFGALARWQLRRGTRTAMRAAQRLLAAGGA